jgi:D-sedoheptulose 7-phosphate isomerase
MAMLEQRIQQQFFDSADLKYAAAETLTRPIAAAVNAIMGSITSGGKVLACGNGGSASDAQHFAAEFVGRFERERPGLAAVALSTDTSILTAIGNDYDFSQVFSSRSRPWATPATCCWPSAPAATPPISSPRWRRPTRKK